MEQRSKRFDQLTWPEVSRAASQPGATVIWPFGACEQHGPQLPLSTDAVFAEGILDSVLAGLDPALPLWRLPCQAIGFSPEHQNFPGTLSLSAPLLLDLVAQVGTQLAAMGVQRLVLFNAHGGQIGLLQVAARQLRGRCPSLAVLPCFLWSGVDGLAELLPEQELLHGLHAGQAETSLMLKLAPELVGSDRPVDGHPLPGSVQDPPDGWSLEGAAPCAWLTDDLSATGVIGDTRQASVDLGRRLEERLIRHWQELLQTLLASDWPPTQSRLSIPSKS
ncbi:creatininase [Synechococcus sp. KORDI-52]|uniref:creatininase family protein n=1 Tax=Synechococcus sp. KORDI-52 TaxID=585425 RepID=UPI0004E0ACC9|nr:creatininase family protein [Synechococcus sp. KORDI-52]AII50103.1 creatininase [Synechococcus sp. KORDI-52]